MSVPSGRKGKNSKIGYTKNGVKAVHKASLRQNDFNGLMKDVMERKSLVIAVIAVIVVLGLVLWYFIFGVQPIANPRTGVPQAKVPAIAQPAATSSLGGQIYQQSRNPLQKKLPDTNPVKNANPLQGAYKNPF